MCLTKCVVVICSVSVHFDKPVTPDFIAEPWFKQKDIIEKAEKKECIPDILLPFNYQVAEDADQSDDIAVSVPY